MTEVRRPQDVLTIQIALQHWWDTSPYSEVVGDQFAAFSMMGGDGRPFKVPVHRYLADRLKRSETIFVAKPIVDRLWKFSETFTTNGVFSREDLPFDRGFVWLEESGYILECRGRMTSIRAMSWAIENAGVMICVYNDNKDPYDELNEITYGPYGGREKTFERVPGLEPRTPLLGMYPLTFGRDVKNMKPEDVSQPLTAPGIDPAIQQLAKEDHILTNRFLFALWDWMQTEIPATAQADKAGEKRVRRAKVDFPAQVKVVDLRPIVSHSAPSEFPEEVQWTHRWPVAEHKRHWYDKNGVYRETTVHSYIKGPDYLPFVDKKSVYNVRR